MKSKLAKARDEWLNSEEGKRCCAHTTTGQYLQNRLELAFLAGAKFTEERIEELEAYVTALKETLYHELPSKYPDNCEVCKGENCGVRGNENIIDGVTMCDYCHAKTLEGK
jgi:hypothetical protein